MRKLLAEFASLFCWLLPKMRMLLAEFPLRVSQDADPTREGSARNVSKLYFRPLPVWHFSAPKDPTRKSCARKIATSYFWPFRCFLSICVPKDSSAKGCFLVCFPLFVSSTPSGKRFRTLREPPLRVESRASRAPPQKTKKTPDYANSIRLAANETELYKNRPTKNTELRELHPKNGDRKSTRLNSSNW